LNYLFSKFEKFIWNEQWKQMNDIFVEEQSKIVGIINSVIQENNLIKNNI